MSDNRRVYRIIRTAIRQLFPVESKGNFARNLNTLAAMIAGIVQGKSCQLPTMARHAPDAAKPDSRIKRYSRWIYNERVDFEAYFLPFAQPILASLARIGPLVFILDGSEVGHHCITLMISLIWQKRALPITWVVVGGAKGHLPEEIHLELLNQLKSLLPEQYQAIFLGDGEFDGIELQAALQALDWSYVCRTAKNTLLYEDEEPFSFADLLLRPGDCLAYLWIVYLGILAHREVWVDIIHRTDRCDWSLFRLGLSLLEHLLNEALPIPVAFNFLEPKSVRY